MYNFGTPGHSKEMSQKIGLYISRTDAFFYSLEFKFATRTGRFFIYAATFHFDSKSSI